MVLWGFLLPCRPSDRASTIEKPWLCRVHTCKACTLHGVEEKLVNHWVQSGHCTHSFISQPRCSFSFQMQDASTSQAAWSLSEGRGKVSCSGLPYWPFLPASCLLGHPHPLLSSAPPPSSLCLLPSRSSTLPVPYWGHWQVFFSLRSLLI